MPPVCTTPERARSHATLPAAFTTPEGARVAATVPAAHTPHRRLTGVLAQAGEPASGADMHGELAANTFSIVEAGASAQAMRRLAADAALDAGGHITCKS